MKKEILRKDKEQVSSKQLKKKSKKKKKRGFTLIELLAVIVILGLLMAIAIPSVTRYITKSRRKTVVSSIDGYISSVVNSVNDQEYKFTEPNTIYAVPIECISLEKGGKNPFGEWLQAEDRYWAYVLVQYDSENFSYNYGFTFKDSAGYGMYPTIQDKINPKSSDQIKTGLELTKPESGPYTNIAVENNWTGFNITYETQVIVLESTEEAADGQTTCDLYQKGNNYEQVKEEKNKKLSTLIKKNNTIITTSPNLKSTSEASNENGLYITTATNDGKPTYYFRGNVNNYVSFAGYNWRIIRINEDGSIRLIIEDIIDSNMYSFSTQNYNNYYSESDIVKPLLDGLYQNYIKESIFDKYIATGTFCEQSKLIISVDSSPTEAIMEYIPNFKCSNDSNGKGIIKSKIGLINLDEVIYAGGIYGIENSTFYLNNNNFFWTMSPAGHNYSQWYVFSTGHVFNGINGSKGIVRPVINLIAGVTATGTGTIDDPYTVITE